MSRAPRPDDSAAAIEAAPMYFFSQDAELRYTSVSRVSERLRADLCKPAETDPAASLKREVLERGVAARQEIVIATTDGSLHFDLTVAPVRDTVGAVCGIACAAYEVTDYCAIDLEVQRMQHQMAEAESLARIGSWEWDVEDDHIRWSPGLFRIYGIEPEELDPRFEARQRDQRVHPDDRTRVEQMVADALRTGQPFDIDYRILRPDGRIRIVHGRCEPISNSHGKVVRLVGTAQDVTEVRLAEDALETTARELGERAAQLHRLTHGRNSGSDEVSLLRPRQIEILELIAEGLSNFEIGERLFISEATVKWHVRQILKTLGVANRTQAVARVFAQP